LVKNFLKENQLNKLYIAEVFRSLAHSSLGIFLPIFILTTGASLSDLSFFYITMFSIGYISGSIAITFFSRKANFVMFISMIFRGLFYFSLYLYTSWHIFAITFGIAIGLYWYIIDLSLLYLPKNQRGLKIGLFYGLTYAASIIGPIFGGYIISFFGYSSLFIYVIILLIPTSITVYLVGKYNWNFNPVKFEFFKKFLKNREGKIFLIFVPIYGIIFVQSIFYYPLLLNQFTGSELGMGVIQTIINILVAVSFLFAGKIFDLKKGRLILIPAVFIVGFALIGIGFSTTIEIFTAFSWLSSFGFALVASPFWAIIGSSTSKKNLANIIVFTNLLLVLGRVIAILLLEPFLAVGNYQFIYISIGALALFGTLIAFLFPNKLFTEVNQAE
jgi:MFS family permease